MATYLSTKTYGTDRGLICCFRQWRSPTGNCVGWHSLTETEYQAQLAQYLAEQEERKQL